MRNKRQRIFWCIFLLLSVIENQIERQVTLFLLAPLTVNFSSCGLPQKDPAPCAEF